MDVYVWKKPLSGFFISLSALPATSNGSRIGFNLKALPRVGCQVYQYLSPAKAIDDVVRPDADGRCPRRESDAALAAGKRLLVDVWMEQQPGEWAVGFGREDPSVRENYVPAVGLVVPAGQRVVPGKMVNETLFARTGQIFLLFNLKPDWWLTNEGKQIALRIGKLMAFSFNAKPLPLKALQELFMEYETKRQSVLEEIATKGDREILEILAGSTLEEHFRIEAYVGSFVSFITQPALLEKLKKIMNYPKIMRMMN